MSSSKDKVWEILGYRYKSHPWHGINIGENAPNVVTAFVEIVPNDTVKYEIDKVSGYLKIDRPQKFSNIIPALYGFVPQTYCGDQVAEFSAQKSGKSNISGDKDPLDICILTERNISHGNLLVEAIPIGGFRLLDGGEADDKIIAVLKGDEVYEQWSDISLCPEALIKRLQHYFLTYKNLPGAAVNRCEITHTYGKEEAHEVIRRSMTDYHRDYGNLEETLSRLLAEKIA
jgi:inorganic pyrophosphatase